MKKRAPGDGECQYDQNTDMYHCTGKLRPGQRSDRECTCSVTAESSSGYAGGAEVLSERSAVRTDVGIL